MQAKIREAINEARAKLDELEKSRDEALKIVRDIISSSGKAITYLLSGRHGEAELELSRMEESRRKLDEALKGYPELMYSGFAQSAYAEYVEAVALHHILSKKHLPRPSELNVHPSAFLLGVADLIGELRRLCLDKVRLDDIDGAFELLDLMDEIYLALRELDYPDPLVPGLRHKVDTMRRVIDDTRAMLVDVENRTKLRKTLESRGTST